MLNRILRNRTVWSFNCVYQKNMFTNHIFNIYVKTGFSIKEPTMVDMLSNKRKLIILFNINNLFAHR